MCNIEEKEYIKTKDGIIAQITKIIDKYSVDCDNAVFDLECLSMMEIPWEYKDEYIIKHSKDITDLIEATDVLMLRDTETQDCIIIGVVKDYLKDWIEDIKKGKLELLGIVTREQFAKGMYKLKE